jgi:hypothetical protein
LRGASLTNIQSGPPNQRSLSEGYFRWRRVRALPSRFAFANTRFRY